MAAIAKGLLLFLHCHWCVKQDWDPVCHHLIDEGCYRVQCKREGLELASPPDLFAEHKKF
eukprot:12439747-Ditylum_brightwellii.AAC.1